MDNQKEKMNIADIQVLAQMPEEAGNISLDLMRGKGMSSVFFLTADSMEICKENAEFKEIVSSCDMVLPGDRATEEEIFSKGGMYVKEPNSGDYMESYLESLFYRLEKENRTVLTVLESEKYLERYNQYMSRYENIQSQGLVFKDYDNTVNEINAVIPDVLLLDMPLENQFVFFKEYSDMMNAKLIIGVDVLNQYLKKMTESVPPLIKALHLENVYHWIKKDSKSIEN